MCWSDFPDVWLISTFVVGKHQTCFLALGKYQADVIREGFEILTKILNRVY